MRLGPFKLIEFYESDSYELYNLEKDISEEYNIINKEKVVAQKMMEMLSDWKADVSAIIPVENPDY